MRGFVGRSLRFQRNRSINLSLGANISYAIIKSRGGDVPCNDASRPITLANSINQCPSSKGAALNQSPRFQASVNGSYSVPVGAADAHFHFNLNYQRYNSNYGNAVSTGAYAIVDLFAGFFRTESVWDVGLYAKNIFDKQVELSSSYVAEQYLHWLYGGSDRLLFSPSIGTARSGRVAALHFWLALR